MRALAPVSVVAALVTLAAAAPAALAAEPGPSPAARAEAVRYEPPADAGLIDTFRPPAEPWGKGNRGVDYATRPGDPVRAAAPGVVTFAGPIAASTHVVVLHADGLRTSYSFLATSAVRRGDRVRAGALLGTAGRRPLHFGARAGDAYLDPLLLFGPATARARLVPDREQQPGSARDEGRSLARFVRGIPAVLAGVTPVAAAWAAAGGSQVAAAGVARAEATAAFLHAALAAATPPSAGTALAHAWAWLHTTCTPPSVPPPPQGRRIAVLVAGLGSAGGSAAVLAVDTPSLGYAAGDVHQFSYRGGTVAERTYTAEDTLDGIGVAGARLRELLERLGDDHPGVPLDVIAHSQGGLVARVAIGAAAPPSVASVVTLGTPHRGADLATAAVAARRSPRVEAVLAAGGRAAGVAVRPSSASIGELAESSAFMRALARQPLPRGVAFTSVAAAGDVVVPVPRTRVAGAGNVTVAVGSANDHASLPGSAAARREIALARSGLPPTCQPFGVGVGGRMLGDAVGWAEDVAGVVVASAAP